MQFRLAAVIQGRIIAEAKSEPAKLLAVFVVDTNETELTNPIRKLRFNTFVWSAMARTYREIAIEEMLGTVEEAMSRVIDWWGDLPPPRSSSFAPNLGRQLIP